jgi:hypothetical protein
MVSPSVGIFFPLPFLSTFATLLFAARPSKEKKSLSPSQKKKVS